MKTKNNVQKAVLRFAAVVVSFVLISYTVSAQEFWKRFLENSSFGHIAMIMADTEAPAVESSSTFSAVDMLMETETESDLEMEPWMTNEANFAVYNLEISEVAEVALELEPWMMDQYLFQRAAETDPALALEAWMVSDAVWSF
ncbi:hypothetical protein [Maribellus mangrovi]|uniref:hypothetical protein n=1 Tax=Maribellus mangrovi TaxID=3133146 RepID=UPI0030EC4F25